jgi:hypothetical protein
MARRSGWRTPGSTRIRRVLARQQTFPGTNGRTWIRARFAGGFGSTSLAWRAAKFRGRARYWGSLRDHKPQMPRGSVHDGAYWRSLSGHRNTAGRRRTSQIFTALFALRNDAGVWLGTHRCPLGRQVAGVYRTTGLPAEEVMRAMVACCRSRCQQAAADAVLVESSVLRHLLLVVPNATLTLE